jgi:hypothetical protein
MPARAVSLRTWQNPPPWHTGKWIVHPRKLSGQQELPDSNKPQEVSSSANAATSYPILSFFARNFIQHRRREAAKEAQREAASLAGLTAAKQRVASELSVVRFRIVERVMEAAAFFAAQC